jgi:hypothetical protein
VFTYRARRGRKFTEGFDTADLKDAKALLDELGLNLAKVEISAT